MGKYESKQRVYMVVSFVLMVAFLFLQKFLGTALGSLLRNFAGIPIPIAVGLFVAVIVEKKKFVMLGFAVEGVIVCAILTVIFWNDYKTLTDVVKWVCFWCWIYWLPIFVDFLICFVKRWWLLPIIIVLDFAVYFLGYVIFVLPFDQTSTSIGKLLTYDFLSNLILIIAMTPLMIFIAWYALKLRKYYLETF